jgi:hypothetical protein
MLTVVSSKDQYVKKEEFLVVRMPSVPRLLQET